MLRPERQPLRQATTDRPTTTGIIYSAHPDRYEHFVITRSLQQVSDPFFVHFLLFRSSFDRVRNHSLFSVYPVRAPGLDPSPGISILLFLRLYPRHNIIIILLCIIPGFRSVYLPPPPFFTSRTIVFLHTIFSLSTLVPIGSFNHFWRRFCSMWFCFFLR